MAIPGTTRRSCPRPFLTFAVAVHRLAAQLDTATYVNEWIGPRRRVPVFAVEPLRRLLADPLRRFFFVELLASYTHVASGSTWVATRRGWRRRRFSELDPVQLAGLLETVPPAERPGVLRRLGDLSLFLTGVFPDHTAATPLGRPMAEAQLLRTRRARDRGSAPTRSAPSSCSSCSAVAGTGSPPGWLRRAAGPSRCSPRSPSSSPTPGASSTPSPTPTCSAARALVRPPGGVTTFAPDFHSRFGAVLHRSPVETRSRVQSSVPATSRRRRSRRPPRGPRRGRRGRRRLPVSIDPT